MVVRIVDVRKYRRAGNVHVEVACEVIRSIAGTAVTELVTELDFDSSILEDDETFINAITQRVSKMYPANEPKKYIGMEIPIG